MPIDVFSIPEIVPPEKNVYANHDAPGAVWSFQPADIAPCRYTFSSSRAVHDCTDVTSSLVIGAGILGTMIIFTTKGKNSTIDTSKNTGKRRIIRIIVTS